jgi:2-polyprenyl-6-methoxyphenol hydroxylase-like FAD-dependent oxidoreductase
VTKHIAIVGGGAAGWLCAARLAAAIDLAASGMRITLVESPDIKNIGVGEGTWPSMRQTLQRIGITEKEFLSCCEASFKQGSKFVGWKRGEDEYYYHPFTEPSQYQQINLAAHWRDDLGRFDAAVAPQSDVCDRHLAPKQLNTPDFAGVLPYGYHLNAGKFIDLLRHYAVDKYGVRHVLAEVTGVVAKGEDIDTLYTRQHGDIQADLFIDCSGLNGLLIDGHYHVPWRSAKQYLFNDAALAMHLPYVDESAPIQSATVATATPHGWVWDIGLSSRRGVGHVYSREISTEAEVATILRRYAVDYAGLTEHAAESLSYRQITFDPGHREVFWQGNCVAIGMAAGFIEPLEATALVLVELAADMLCRELPNDRDVMRVVAARYNKVFSQHWSQIIDFLKLHYVFSERQEPYWQRHREAQSIPISLAEQLLVWRTRAPWHDDAIAALEMFPSASYQYVLYGMGFAPPQSTIISRQEMALRQQAGTLFEKNQATVRQLREHLPTNRFLVSDIAKRGIN